MFPVHETAWQTLVVISTLGYLLGSIPFGMVVARLTGLGNLRDIGSGNIGATNVLRTGNKPAALLTLLLDAGKGGAAVLITGVWFGADAMQFAGLFAFLGHLFPVWIRFRGGKGVATFLGLVLALGFWAGLAACLVWLLVAFLFRFSSLAGLVSVASAPIWFTLFGNPSGAGLAILLALLIWVRHRENITRLIKGTESRIGGKG